jgi:hypothetical protein
MVQVPRRQAQRDTMVAKQAKDFNRSGLGGLRRLQCGVQCKRIYDRRAPTPAETDLLLHREGSKPDGSTQRDRGHPTEVPDRSADRWLTMRGMGALISQTSTPRRMAGYLRLREAASERPGHRVVFLTSSRHIAHVWDRNRTGGCISSMTPPSIVGVADFAASATEPTVRV